MPSIHRFTCPICGSPLLAVYSYKRYEHRAVDTVTGVIDHRLTHTDDEDGEEVIMCQHWHNLNDYFESVHDDNNNNDYGYRVVCLGAEDYEHGNEGEYAGELL